MAKVKSDYYLYGDGRAMRDHYNLEIGRQIREERIKKKVSLAKLSSDIKIDMRILWEIEQGKWNVTWWQVCVILGYLAGIEGKDGQKEAKNSRGNGEAGSPFNPPPG